MTNKKAAYILSNECHEYTVKELDEAFTLAIKALEERPRGEWLRANGTYYCSCCKHYAYESQKFDFCQDCGADIERRQRMTNIINRLQSLYTDDVETNEAIDLAIKALEEIDRLRGNNNG